jgi:hypothetical protein
MIDPAFPAAIPVPLFRQGYSPVNNAYREGVQVDDVAYALVNLRPCLAIRSIFVVFIFVAPLQLLTQ